MGGENRTPMGLISFASNVRRLLKLADKPSREEMWLSVRICLLGFSVVGIIAYIVHLVASAFLGLGG